MQGGDAAEAKCLAIADHMSRILSEYAKDGQLRKAYEEGFNVVQSVGLAWQQDLRPDMVGAHPANRGGAGLHGAEVHRFGNKHCNAGYSFALACNEFKAQRNHGVR